MSQPVIAISGAGKGIGRATAIWFAEKNWRVFAFSRTQSDLQSLERLFPENIIGFTGDASNDTDVNAFRKFVLEKCSGVDVVVNNAGLFRQSSFLELTPEILEDQWKANTLSTLLFSKAFLPEMVSNRSGQIINVISVAALRSFNGSGAYCSSKSAQHGLVRVMREELKAYNIRVTNVFPGAAFTNSWVGTGADPEQMMTAENVAAVIGNAVNLSENVVQEDIILRPVGGDL